MLEALGYESARIVKDDGFSGKDLNRPGIQSVLKEIGIPHKDRTFEGIIFFRLDRLTRNPRDLYGLIDLFKQNEIDFISVRENLDSSSALGRVVIGIIGLLSAFERELTGERVKASGIARVRQGRWVGGLLSYGYKLINDGPPLPDGRQPHKIVIDEELAPKLRQIWQMAAENKSLMFIGRELEKQGIKTPTGKVWRKQVLWQMVRNKFYLGYVKWSGETHKGNHEPLIDKETWEKANKFLSANLPGHRFAPKPKSYIYLVESLLRCGQCQSKMLPVWGSGHTGVKFHYYICSRRKQGLGCDADRISALGFDKALVEYFRRSSYDQRLIIKAIEDSAADARAKLNSADKQISAVEKKLEPLRTEAEKLLNLALQGEITKGQTYKTRMAKLDEEIEALENELSMLEARKKAAEMSANSGHYIHSGIVLAMAKFDKASPEAQKALFHALIKEIVIHDAYVEIKMFVGEPLKPDFSDILLNGTHLTNGHNPNEKRPIPKDEALSTAQPSSLSGRQQWLPRQDSNLRHAR